MVASGGELSRIMLAIKTVLAETDQVPTLIFDEIDTGISGRTAQMVSEKLRILSKCRQVICITHLPQIAAMADQHFEIRKSASDGRTATSIRALRPRGDGGRACETSGRRGDHRDRAAESGGDEEAGKEAEAGGVIIN